MRQRIVLQRAALDTSHFPLVVLSEYGVLTDLERVRVVEELEGLTTRPDRHAIILDLTQGAPVPPAQRAHITERFLACDALIVEKWIAIAVLVCGSSLDHAAMAAFWIKVSPVPARMFPSAEAAVCWIQACARLSSTGAIPIVRPSPGTRPVAGRTRR